jgi:hypothetical protein
MHVLSLLNRVHGLSWIPVAGAPAAVVVDQYAVAVAEEQVSLGVEVVFLEEGELRLC